MRLTIHHEHHIDDHFLMEIIVMAAELNVKIKVLSAQVEVNSNAIANAVNAIAALQAVIANSGAGDDPAVLAALDAATAALATSDAQLVAATPAA